jgi:hypothetical protein
MMMQYTTAHVTIQIYFQNNLENALKPLKTQINIYYFNMTFWGKIG